MKTVKRHGVYTAIPENPQELVALAVEVAAKIGKHPLDLTVVDMRKHGNIGEKSLRKFGPWPTFKRANFAPEAEPDYKSVIEAASTRSYIAKLERIVGTQRYLADQFEERMTKLLKKSKVPKVRVKVPRKGKQSPNRAVFAVLSDLHFGYSVDPMEVPGAEWNPKIAARRSAFYALEVSEFKRMYRSHQQLVVCLNGDIIQGIVHLDDKNLEDVVTQLWYAHWYISHMITIWAQTFPEVRVFCQTGNHDRMTYRGPGRVRVQKWESHTTLLFLWLKSTFSDQKNIEFIIDRSPVSRIAVLGNVYALTHGDTDLSISNPGRALNTKEITDQLNSLARSPQFNGKLDAAILGHHHAPTFTTLPNGMDLVVNGCMDGVSPYAASIGYRHNHPSQVVFEATEGHPVGDFRNIRLWYGDNDSALDKVIPEAPPWG